MEWIKVEDNLPEHNTEVLTITKDDWYRVVTFGSTGRSYPCQVTHWMPLPEPPKQ